MSRNLKPFVLEDKHMTGREVLRHLSEQVPGRSIGDRFVVAAEINVNTDLELELDDGSKYTFQCKKVK